MFGNPYTSGPVSRAIEIGLIYIDRGMLVVERRILKYCIGRRYNACRIHCLNKQIVRGCFTVGCRISSIVVYRSTLCLQKSLCNFIKS